MPAATTEQIIRGKALVQQQSDIKFELGDILLEIAPTVASANTTSGQDWQTHPDRTHVETFCDEIGLAYESAIEYRRVAEVFGPKVRRNDVSWAVHRTLRSHLTPVKVLKQGKHWTYRSAREFMAEYRATGARRSSETGSDQGFSANCPAERTTTPTPATATPTVVSESMSTEQKAELAKKLLADDDARRLVVADKATSRAVSKEQYTQERERHALYRAEEPAVDAVASARETLDATSQVDHAAADLRRFIRSIASGQIKLGNLARESLEMSIDNIHLSLQWIETFLNTGDIDAELASILESETK